MRRIFTPKPITQTSRAPPTPAVGPLASIEWIGAIGANRCAVGTTLIQRWSRGATPPTGEATRSSARRLESAMGE